MRSISAEGIPASSVERIFAPFLTQKNHFTPGCNCTDASNCRSCNSAGNTISSTRRDSEQQFIIITAIERCAKAV